MANALNEPPRPLMSGSHDDVDQKAEELAASHRAVIARMRAGLKFISRGHITPIPRLRNEKVLDPSEARVD